TSPTPRSQAGRSSLPPTTREALAPYSAHKADRVCHVPDGADGGVCGCERTIGRAARAGSFHACGAVDLLPQDVLFAGVVGSTGRGCLPGNRRAPSRWGAV